MSLIAGSARVIVERNQMLIDHSLEIKCFYTIQGQVNEEKPFILSIK